MNFSFSTSCNLFKLLSFGCPCQINIRTGSGTIETRTELTFSAPNHRFNTVICCQHPEIEPKGRVDLNVRQQDTKVRQAFRKSQPFHPRWSELRIEVFRALSTLHDKG